MISLAGLICSAKDDGSGLYEVEMAGRLLGLTEPGSYGRGEVGFAVAATGSSAPLTARTHPPIAAPRTHLNTERPTAVVCARVHPATAIGESISPRVMGDTPDGSAGGTRAPNARPKMVRPYRVVAM